MKKLIALFGSLTLVLSSSTLAVSCSKIHETDTSNKRKDKKTNDVNHKHARFDLIENEEQMMVGELTKGIDGSHLSTNNTISDAFELIVKQMLMDCPEVEDIKLTDESKMESNLKLGNNPIEISFKAKKQLQKLRIIVKNVQNASEANQIKDPVSAKTKIKQMLKSGIGVNHLYGWNTIFDALDYINNEVKKINKHANVRFSASWLKKRMGDVTEQLAEQKIKTESKEQLEELKAAVKQEEKTDQVVTSYNIGGWMGEYLFGNIVDMIINPLARAFGIAPDTLKHGLLAVSATWLLKYTGFLTPIINFFKQTSAKIFNCINEKGKKVFTSIRTWFYDKFYAAKHTKPTFLSTNNLETFGLNLYLDTDKDEIKRDIENSNNNTVEEIIETNLIGIQPRSRENAKKIIEKQIYTFNKPLSYQQVIEQVKEHIKNTMFPDDVEQEKFEFRAIFKNQKDKDKILHPGLNKIELVLNPKKSLANWFGTMFGTKKPITINLQVDYKK